MPHISYFINLYTFRGFINSLLALPGHNARGATSRSLRPVPWGDQYKIGSDYWIATYPKLDSEEDEYEEYDYDYDEVFEDYIVEHLTHKGWVQV